MPNLSPAALHLLHIHAKGGWELVAQRVREEVAAARDRIAMADVNALSSWIEDVWVKYYSATAPSSETWNDALSSAIIGRYGVPPSTAPATPPQLPAWCFQPDGDTPGLYLQCENREQRDAIMRALGWKPEPPLTLRTAAAKALCLLDTCGISGGDIDRAQKLLRDAIAGECG